MSCDLAHRQLPPVVRSAEAARRGLGVTLFERLLKQHPDLGVMLTEQYRMHADICRCGAYVIYTYGCMHVYVYISIFMMLTEQYRMHADICRCGARRRVCDIYIYVYARICIYVYNLYLYIYSMGVMLTEQYRMHAVICRCGARRLCM